MMIRPRARHLSALLLSLLSLFATADPASDDPFRGFEKAVEGWEWEFPRDHGSHPQFSTEWWYFTGHLWDADDHRFGFELTFFRVGIRPPGERRSSRSAWTLDDLAIAHFAITDTDAGTFRFHELMNRESPFTATSARGDLDVRNGSWRAERRGDDTIRIFAMAEGDLIELDLLMTKAPVVHGRNGLSVKSNEEGYASHYYSLSRLTASGRIVSDGREEEVTGIGWMDHEFGSAVLNHGQVGWDWFAIQLDDGTELMVYEIRTVGGEPDSTSAGTFIRRDGAPIHLDVDDFSLSSRDSWTSGESGATYPVDWIVEIPSLEIRLEIRPVMLDQELRTGASTRVTYWEGAVEINGRSGGSPVHGWGYVEMTGYDK